MAPIIDVADYPIPAALGDAERASEQSTEAGVNNSPVPKEALAHHLAFLGKTGSGKSNGAKVIVEGLLDEGERVCVIDPTGAWYGLRLNANGKPSPYPVVIFGGLHADMPISAGHGGTIADVIATSSTPAVIDTRLMNVNERTRFFTDFAQTLLRKNRGPLHLVIDEAHIFAPQQGGAKDPQRADMLHAANNLVSLGRSAGLRITLISQRPAKLHKDSLTQVETLVAMRVIHNLDRKAVEDWIGECADPAQGKEIVASLAGLPTGDAWIWSPGIGLLERKHFPLARTYDSGKAPAGIDEGPQLKPLDLDKLKGKLASLEEEQKANDPRALKAEVARLARELAAAQRGSAPPWPDQREDVSRLIAELAESSAALERLTAAAKELQQRQKKALAALNGEEVEIPKTPQRIAVTPARATATPPPQRAQPEPRLQQTTGNSALRPSHQKVLDALAWWKSAGFPAVERRRACIMAGYSPKASTFGVYISELTRDGLVEVPEPGRLRLTPAGEELANAPEMTTPDAILQAARNLLSPAEIRLFDEIVNDYPEWVARHDLADRVGLSRTASTLGVYLSKIGSFDFIESGRGTVRAADWLFP